MLATVTTLTAALQAQQPPAQPPAGAPAKQARAEAPLPESYTYQAEGRRDPFVTLLGTGPQLKASTRRPDGPAGLSANDIAVRGVMQSRGTLIAMIAGPDHRTYIVHKGDKLLDATIKAITSDGLVMVQDVHDPLSVVKQREVRKTLHSPEDSKE
jgi:Tfp pilus assembly protein PilP